VAVHFLQSVPSVNRCQMRRIVLLEDHVYVAFPECHAQGLIPFCRKNTSLRVERRVSLWRNVFQSDPMCPSLEERFMSQRRLSSKRVTKSVALWMVEADVLGHIGMPAYSFRLVIDDDPTPNKTAEVFRDVV